MSIRDNDNIYLVNPSSDEDSQLKLTRNQCNPKPFSNSRCQCHAGLS